MNYQKLIFIAIGISVVAGLLSAANVFDRSLAWVIWLIWPIVITLMALEIHQRIKNKHKKD
jgi:branched-subunit amino acid permease